jgi:hypothetical protein
MTHRLSQRHPLHACGPNPLIASLRYRCECAGNEVLQIQVVIDKDATEEMFVMTMRQLWRDVKFEVEQHINPPNTDDGAVFGSKLT